MNKPRFNVDITKNHVHSKDQIEYYYNDANWRCHLIYIFSDILSNHLDYVIKDLELLQKDIRGTDKHHLNEILRGCKTIKYHGEQLFKESIASGGDKEVYIYDSWVLIFQALILRLLMVIGIDNKSNIRAYNLYQKLKKMPNQILPREMNSIESQAFNYLLNLIDNGKITQQQIDQIFDIPSKGSGSKTSEDKT